jgi:hypothetical protein
MVLSLEILPFFGLLSLYFVVLRDFSPKVIDFLTKILGTNLEDDGSS